MWVRLPPRAPVFLEDQPLIATTFSVYSPCTLGRSGGASPAIIERVRAGLRNARAKGKTLGRPRVAVDTAKVASLRTSGASWQTITRQLGISAGTAKRAFYSLSKNPSRS
jgi:hypothetical protein